MGFWGNIFRGATSPGSILFGGMDFGGILTNNALGLHSSTDIAWDVMTGHGLRGLKQDWSTIKHWLVPDMRRDREITANSSTTAQRIIYGTTRVSGQLAYVESAGANFQELHLVFILAAHPVSGFGDIYLDNKLITDPLFTGKVHYELFDGTQTAACATLVAASKAGAISRWVPIYGPPTPIYDETGLIGEEQGPLLNSPPTEGLWTNRHIGYGRAYLYLRLTYSESAFPAGIPTPKVVVHGKKVYDPRTATTAVSSNPAINIRDYMLIPAALGGGGYTTAEIDGTALEAAADVCDQTVAFDGGSEPRYTMDGVISLDTTPAKIVEDMVSAMSGQIVLSDGLWKLYAGSYSAPVKTLDEKWLNGGISFQTATNKSNRANTVKGTFTDPLDSWAEKQYPIVPQGNAPPSAVYWTPLTCPTYVVNTIYATLAYVTRGDQAYQAIRDVPAIDATPPNATYWSLVDDYNPDTNYTVSQIVQRAGLVYEASGAVPINNPYLDQDGGEELLATLNLPFCLSPHLAQRLAGITLRKARRGLTVSYPCNMQAFNLQPMDLVAVNNSLLGWAGRTFRVLSWEFSPMTGVSLSLGEDDADVWTDGTTIPLTAIAQTELPDPRYVTAPVSLTFVPYVYDFVAGVATRVDLDVSWGAAGPSPNLLYTVQYQLEAGAWVTMPTTRELAMTIKGLVAGRYNVRVRGANSIGASGDWVSGTSDVPAPDTTVPNVTGLQLFGQGNDSEFVGRDVKLSWNKVTPRSTDTVETVASPSKAPSWFRYYQLNIFGADGVLRRTEFVITESYSYDYEKNYVDGKGATARELLFELRAVSTWGGVSNQAATLIVSNPVPPVVTGVVVAPSLKSIIVDFEPSQVPDVTGYQVHVSDISGFTPAPATMAAKGAGSHYGIKAGIGTHYVRVGAYDSFDDNGLIFSDELPVTVLGNQVLPDDLYTTLRADFLVQGSIFYFGDHGASPTPGTEDTLYWTDGVVTRGADNFTLDGGYIMPASNSWIIATLAAGTVVLSLIGCAGGGVPALDPDQVILGYTSAAPNSAGNYLAYIRQANSLQLEGASIRDLTVQEASIANAAITSAKIGDLAVETLHIQDGAVTVPIDLMPADISITAPGATLLDYNLTVSADTVGKPHLLLYSAQSTAAVYLITRVFDPGSTAIKLFFGIFNSSGGSPYYTNGSGAFIPVSTGTYRILAYVWGGPADISNANFFIQVAKK